MSSPCSRLPRIASTSTPTTRKDAKAELKVNLGIELRSLGPSFQSVNLGGAPDPFAPRLNQVKTDEVQTSLCWGAH